ncbi:hypothetical protein K437DRAFT_255905 [Tilletiaria anomala UBC 951]|uniref:Cation/H+ exchanger transmembrane domain-containing protein n=1 Tax=Tilletiaria anomala (strain ATCC 24038 / CBS 436.72 / UBC 951) TaxID=1037660 RepID=A0A066W8I3_TILAU|nr:uncharacterized protein K437DRAFT_255905 [Tilletiaria anomala UBC 951]KDN47359.1 hypothetical protein K437DRAFT_255905 [Tilletiaria anomala UBC 951]
MTGSLSEHAFKPFEVSAAHLVYVGFGAFVVIFASFALFIKEKLYLGEAPIAAVFGIIVGPIAINLFHPAQWGAQPEQVAPGNEITNEISLELLRVTIALAVFAAGVELPKKYLLRHWRSLSILLGPVMVYGWLLTAAFIYALIPRLDFLNSLVVAAAVTPTDPVLSASVVGGPWAEKHVPAHIRHLLICESGCNDGAAFPFLYLALYLSFNRDNVRYAVGRWVYETILYEIVMGTILGALIGYAARKMIRFSERHKLVDRESFVAQYVSLALLSMGVNVLLGSDDLLAAFACGAAFAWDGWFTRQTEDSNFSSVVDLLFNVATFIYIGAQMPFSQFTGGGHSQLELWRLFVIAILTLLFKRIPIVLALWKYIPDIKTFRDALFVGHTAPIGTGAIFISTLGRTLMPAEVPIPPQTSNDVLALSILPITYFIVLCSIAVHGLTIPVFSFSKGAHKVTRTWSRHTSFADGEPSWMTRAMRRTRTGESQATSMQYDEDGEGGGMSEIRRVLAAQLANIGKGAIGGEEEKELRDRLEGDEEGRVEGTSPNATTSDSSSTAFRDRRVTPGSQDIDLEKGEATGDLGVGMMEKLEKGNLDDAIDDLEDGIEADDNNACSEWTGEDTCEMRRYREQQKTNEATKAALKLAHAQQRQQEREQGEPLEDDLGEAPMDRDISPCRIGNEGQAATVTAERGRMLSSAAYRHRDGGDEQREQGEDEYPLVREWIEGNHLVLELCKSRLEEPIVEVIHLTDEEKAAMNGHQSKSFKWVRDHASELKLLVKDDVASEWTLENARHKLLQHGIPGKLANAQPIVSQRTEREAFKQTAEGHISSKEAMKEIEGCESTPSPRDSPRQGNSPNRKSQEETAAERQARADLLYGALNWASEQRGTDSDPSSTADKGRRRPSPPQSRSSGSKSLPDSNSPSRKSTTSTLPPRKDVPATTNKATYRPVGARRESMRKKLLSGKISLSGRRTSSAVDVDDADEGIQEEVEMEAPAETHPTPQSHVRALKNFPRSASLGGLGYSAPDEEASGQASPSSLRGHHRASSIVWMDIEDGHDRTPRTPLASASIMPRKLRSRTNSNNNSNSNDRDRSVQFAETSNDDNEGGSENGQTPRHKYRGLAGLISSLRSGATARDYEEPSEPETPPQQASSASGILQPPPAKK